MHKTPSKLLATKLAMYQSTFTLLTRKNSAHVAIDSEKVYISDSQCCTGT